MFGDTPTDAQDEYVRALQKRLRLPNGVLDTHCLATFGAAYAALTRRDVTVLIDQLLGWKSIPADLQRSMGQQDLFPA